VKAEAIHRRSDVVSANVSARRIRRRPRTRRARGIERRKQAVAIANLGGRVEALRETHEIVLPVAPFLATAF